MTYRILITDDSSAIRRSLRTAIEKRTGWLIWEAENGKVAVEKVRELRPDLVILDWQMPVMNGIDAAREITALAPNIPIFMFTLFSYVELVRDATSAGIRKVFSKSEGLSEDLIVAIREILESRTQLPV